MSALLRHLTYSISFHYGVDAPDVMEFQKSLQPKDDMQLQSFAEDTAVSSLFVFRNDSPADGPPSPDDPPVASRPPWRVTSDGSSVSSSHGTIVVAKVAPALDNSRPIAAQVMTLWLPQGSCFNHFYSITLSVMEPVVNSMAATQTVERRRSDPPPPFLTRRDVTSVSRQLHDLRASFLKLSERNDVPSGQLLSFLTPHARKLLAVRAMRMYF